MNCVHRYVSEVKNTLRLRETPRSLVEKLTMSLYLDRLPISPEVVSPTELAFYVGRLLSFNDRNKPNRDRNLDPGHDVFRFSVERYRHGNGFPLRRRYGSSVRQGW